MQNPGPAGPTGHRVTGGGKAVGSERKIKIRPADRFFPHCPTSLRTCGTGRSGRAMANGFKRVHEDLAAVIGHRLPTHEARLSDTWGKAGELSELAKPSELSYAWHA